MAASGDLVDFDVIEGQKENIQSLPGGRSAKKLADMYSSSPLQKLATPTPSDTRNVNDCIRAEYEAEIDNLSEADDPLDIFDRYVRWTLDAYPSAQATPQSQLHTVLERATKTFISSGQYKNDPRYLKMWLQYIHFFTDAPRETYVFLSRHGIGERLALYYEEYAGWLESAGRWAQAEEIYRMGIEREARPVQRLSRKFKEFEERRQAHQPDNVDGPSSPALPTVRPALAAKTDPFSAAAAASRAAAEPQATAAASQRAAGASGSSKPAKPKMAIFSDITDSKPPVLSSRETGAKGWDTIGSMAERKKENTIEPKPWLGETLKTGGKKSTAAKMSVFRDPSLSQINNIVVVPSKNQSTVHPQTGKRERIFVDLATVYPTPDEPGTELSFEEVMATRRGWLDRSWEEEAVDINLVPEPAGLGEIEEISKGVGGKLTIHRDVDENGVAMEPPKNPRAAKKKKLMEVNETQIIKAKLDSPSGPKLKKRNTSEPTMTLHTKAATDDIYDIFNAPLQPANEREEEEEEGSGDEDDYETDGDYTTDGESNATTTRHIDATEHIEEEQTTAVGGDDEDAKSESEWSDFSAQKHMPGFAGNDTQMSDLIDAGQPDENQAPLGIFHDPGQGDEEDSETSEDHVPRPFSTSFMPIPPEDFDVPTRPYRDPAEVANSRLPFMTPITERTEVSLEMDNDRRDQFKTPCKRDESSTLFEEDEEDENESLGDLEPMSSPLRDDASPPKPMFGANKGPLVPKAPLGPKPAIALSKKTAASTKPLPPKGPIIKDAQCNPVGEEVRTEILANLHPPLYAYRGFYDHRHEKYERGNEIRKFAKSMQRSTKTASGDRAGSLPAPVHIEFPDVATTYTLKRELGTGAFAPVYLVENSDPDEDGGDDENAVAMMGRGSFAVNHRHHNEALKMEVPPTPWEFHMMRTAHSRLGPQHRASASLSYAHAMHLYQDEGFLFLPLHPHGTLLDVVNFFRAEASGVMDEQLAMFFTIELMRTVEALHAKGIMHGDIKPDNCVLRLDNLGEHHLHHHEELQSQWRPDGRGGWDARGIVLIDFGRSIDMRAFVPDVQFIADWKTSSQDCAEMREGRPWTWQIDYHGLAGMIHCLLFGKYIETVRCDQGGIGFVGRRYRIRESLKRYWQTDLWSDCFDVLLNPAAFLEAEPTGRMPVLRSMRSVRERMERWLEDNCERGVGLKALVGRLEAFAKGRRH
ncbi:checkpoint serine/threonine-protein kinase [Geosmithia morbida]|uniref:Checkpoint serine/threonine-protein kinase n=1 Tax=Geosmithia morbida TaxID=1094350 RepID=A0A9P4YX13_9HYPO|nr:checkpoint serine/threonine-protein kinase [Geosmithia morbida]KAF4123339.1 checkpoint serine/threonine-protein kinase [Geosmithia morbida]